MEFSCNEFADLAKCESSLNPDALKLLKEAATADDAAILAAKHKFKSEIRTAIDIMEFLE